MDNEDEVALVKWLDNKAVTLASSCAAISPFKEVRHFCREERRRVVDSTMSTWEELTSLIQWWPCITPVHSLTGGT